MTTLPLGPVVTGENAQLPQRVSLRGRYSSLLPIVESHFPALFASLGQPEHYPFYTYFPEGPDPFPKGWPDFEARMLAKVHSKEPGAVYWVCTTSVPTREHIDAGHRVQTNSIEQAEENVEDMSVEGQIALWRTDLAHRSTEISHVMFGQKMRGTKASTEIIYLLLSHIFDTLHFRRVEWKCHTYNEPSKRAAKRFGFTFEGVFRQHMILQGRNRDTAWFSMLDAEWAVVKESFEEWLSEHNFDGNDKQICKLEDIRERIATTAGRAPLLHNSN